MKFNFCGDSYTSQSINVASDKTLNFYKESTEGHDSKTDFALYHTPGLSIFCTLAGGTSIRGSYAINGREFRVCGVNFYELFSDGTFTLRGTVLNDDLPVSFTSSSTQLLLASNGTAYVLTFSTNAFVPATGVTNVSKVDFCDGFFVALIGDSNRFQISNLEDAINWDPLDSSLISVFSDNIVSMIVDHREIWFFGITSSTVYYNSGNALFPFEVNASAGVIQMGTAAEFSPVQLDNTVFILGADSRGQGMVWRMQGYTPQRISNHAVEYALSTYSTISDCIAYGYQDQGHSFYVLRFPTANKTWVYDVSTGQWHERAFFDASTGLYTAHRSQNHTFNFGKHLVGDWATPNVYEMSIDILDDFGNEIHRISRAPHVSEEQHFFFHSMLQVDVETGDGPQPPLLDGSGNPRAPQMSLKWSNDGGHTWSNGYIKDCGQGGDYKKRVMWWRLGRARDRVYEIEVSDAIPWRIVDSYLELSAGSA